ncbi:transglutaminase family protein [Aquibium carbonis]|uniref:Transglutaminase family protein n=1 Tax=Aquibium carbonis TaxID=2495581 RepID=A0A429YYY3_9HYPH|nr:transglutaminase family protein [Aquibium carbonis]RST86669.1 transglutaminase family protein [Aquibium carbonis]
MRLKITHRTEYSYVAPLGYALQRLRLTPYSGGAQTVRSWSLAIEGAREEVRFVDQFGNETILISAEGGPHAIVVEVRGEVDVQDTTGVTGLHRGFAPLWLFTAATPLTMPGEGIAALAASIGEGSELERLHGLMAAVAKEVAYVKGTTDAATAAEDALLRKSGVCQDHAHVFISAARALGFPARYISGYLYSGDAPQQAASHAWAEAHVSQLGWVGFDPSNDMCPDDRYVRLATGRDYRDAVPVSGIRHGSGEELLAVSVTVEQ